MVEKILFFGWNAVFSLGNIGFCQQGLPTRLLGSAINSHSLLILLIYTCYIIYIICLSRSAVLGQIYFYWAIISKEKKVFSTFSSSTSISRYIDMIYKHLTPKTSLLIENICKTYRKSRRKSPQNS